jgi:hypothetical protein
VAQDGVNLNKVMEVFWMGGVGRGSENDQKVKTFYDVECSDFVPNLAGLGGMICDRKNLTQLGEVVPRLQ